MRRSPSVYFVYILSSLSGTLYVGISNNVQRRTAEHWIGKSGSFTSRYAVNRLVYFECFGDVVKAIAREKQIKGWRRETKIVLIESMNPSWRDLRETLLQSAIL
jgi:putative endonuclease